MTNPPPMTSPELLLPCPLKALQTELEALKVAACDTRYSSAAIGIRVRNCWSIYEAGLAALIRAPSTVGVKSLKPLPGELALIQIAMETLRHIANYTPVSRIQPVMIARDALKKIDALTFESEPVKALAASPTLASEKEGGKVEERRRVVDTLRAHLKIGGHDAWEGHYYFVDGIEAAADALLAPASLIAKGEGK